MSEGGQAIVGDIVNTEVYLTPRNTIIPFNDCLGRQKYLYDQATEFSSLSIPVAPIKLRTRVSACYIAQYTEEALPVRAHHEAKYRLPMRWATDGPLCVCPVRKTIRDIVLLSGNSEFISSYICELQHSLPPFNPCKN